MEPRTKRVIEIWSTIGGLLIVGLLFAWCAAPSTKDVKKADKQANISAQANANSVVAETEANNLSNQAKQSQANTNAARKDFNKATTAARKPVKKDKYEKTRNTPVTVDTRNLDARERDLLTKLRKLYWQQPK